MFNKLRTVIYHADNVEKAKQWYMNITGVQPYFDQPFYVGFNINGCELGLDPDMTGVEKGNYSVAYWSVDDIKAATEKLIANNAKLLFGITEVGDGIKVAVFEDPFENTFGLIEESKRNLI